jgi:O-succinylbenzoic acid--CoA ligase
LSSASTDVRSSAAGSSDAGSSDDVDDSVAVVITTSGSSGYPKRVALSAAALVASATATERALGGPGRWVLAMPAHYIAGVQVLVRSSIAGTTPEVLPEGGFRVDAFVAAAARTTTQGARSYTALVPAQVSRLLDDEAGREALAAFDAVIVGGQAVPAALRERAETADVRLVRSYGSSETAGGCVYDGRPLDGVLVRVDHGEIEIGGPTLALGYLGEPERTSAAFREDDGHRWFRTGDTGSVDDQGVVDVFGRIDNVIVSGGINVSLDRVEALVRERPGFGEAVVVGAEDSRWGSVPVVVTDARAPDGILPDLRSAAEESLGVAARPARIVRLERIPMLATGKPDRRAIARIVERSARGPADHGADSSTL